MLLAPSEIHFLHNSASSYILTPDVIDDVGHRLTENRERVPRIQVVEKDGVWFALNDSYLHVYRELERQGRCPKIRVDVVALSKVPQDVQKGMIVVDRRPSNDVPTSRAPVTDRTSLPRKLPGELVIGFKTFSPWNYLHSLVCSLLTNSFRHPQMPEKCIEGREPE